uniref:FeS assembly protein SufD n=1 Tax=Erwinia amylovora ATCC BAA-2158 TaxID=889211 RepID=E5B4Z7_ERWAM|nr:FeS assembly protein SufD [Erwinia amylovora ATCC BAA-2158]
MAGLPTRSDSALQQWHHLFETRGECRSIQAQQHWQQLLRTGLPTRKQEDWKYTPLDQLLNNQFVMPEPAALDAEAIKALALPIDAVRLVFIDGRFSPELSDSEHDLFTIRIAQSPERRELSEPVHPEVFLHLTESLAEQVTFMQLARGKAAARPLYLLHISSGSTAGELNTSHYRHHLQLDEAAEATVIEHYLSLDAAPHFTGARFTAEVGNNAALTHYNLAFEDRSSYHLSHNDLTLGRDTRVQSHSFLLGAGLTRHHTSTRLDGEGSFLAINSLMLPMDKEVCDSRTWLEHNKGYCQSRQLHKTIVRDRARAVFNGIIKVAKHALKTDGQMNNNNLLLGRLAEVDTKPQLEIYADDVKCGHGATIGRIDEEQMFYLRSRGIDEAAAQRMIIYAFAAELTEAITDETLKEAVMQRIAQRFPGGLQ